MGWAGLGWAFEIHECGEPSLLFPEASDNPGACQWWSLGWAWGHLLLLPVPLGASSSLNTVVFVPKVPS